MLWHPTHVVGSPPNEVGEVWHLVQSSDLWAPVSANDVLLWLKVEGFQPLVVWHCPQLEPIAPVWFAGFLWHEAQMVGAPV